MAIALAVASGDRVSSKTVGTAITVRRADAEVTEPTVFDNTAR